MQHLWSFVELVAVIGPRQLEDMNATIASPARAVVKPWTGTVQLIGVPMDLGASRRGVDMGPSAMRLSSLTAQLERLGLTVEDAGNVPVPDRTSLGSDPRAVLDAITAVCIDLPARWPGLPRRSPSAGSARGSSGSTRTPI
jgi:hypothetical protein